MRSLSGTARAALGLALALYLLAVFPMSAGTVSVFAAASLTDSLKEIAAGYEKEGGDKILFNFAASSFLERQIEEGAPSDIFFSADEARMDALQGKGLILVETRKSRLSNSLVIVVAVDSDFRVSSPADLAGGKFKRIALADPETVPAGIYAKAYFQQARLWPALQEKVVPTDNVRAALSAVEAGNVEAGVVYKTDATISKKVRIAYEIPRSEGPVIRYAVAMLKDAARPEAAKSFLRYLMTAESGRVFGKFGFIVLD